MAITGAGGGLGGELARKLRAEGANVALLDLRPDIVNELAEELGGARFARGWSVDVRDLAALEAVMDEVAEHFGGIDVVVAAAGVLGALQTIEPTPADDWDRVIDVNLNGLWRTMKVAAPHVRASQGHMVALSSMIAYIHPPLLGSYAASKAGVAAFIDVLRLEMRASGVTVGSVHPAIFRTPMIGDALESPAGVELVNDFTGVFETTELETVVDEIVKGIEKRSKRVVVPRKLRFAAFMPGAVQAIIERLEFRPKSVARAIELGSEPGVSS
ncbi:MAG: SDR family NAD(P)-dependent oxidoreductase [Thermoleophilaceae bacterium]|nr:SDR family NAD(P)-dependent oxidoreductase [Thermoleophilaceae bacterium]